MRLLKQQLQAFWRSLALAASAGLINGISTTGLIAVISGEITQATFTAQFAGLFFGFCLLRLTTGIVSRILLIRISQKIVLDLRMTLSRQILASSLFHLESLGNHRLIASLIDDIEKLANAVYVLPAFCGDIAIVASCLVYLCWLSPILFSIVLCFMAIGIVSYQFASNRAFRYLKQARHQQDKLFQDLSSLTDGIKELKLNRERRQTFLTATLYPTAQNYRHQHVIGMTIFAGAATWGHLLFFLVVGIIIFVLPAISKIQPAILSSYAITIIYLTIPLDYIMSSLPAIGNIIVALQAIEDLQLSLAISPPDIPLKSESILSCQSLQLAGVTHTYYGELEDHTFKLGEINLQLSAGEITFIIGGNGSGKSTLVKVLAGLYFPEMGEIRLNGKRISPAIEEWYRQHFSVVFSDFYLFENLSKNIDPEIEEQANLYLKKLQLNQKVSIQGNTFSTTSLSKGQRKRLALLNAYLENKPILIFDEWASDQDPIFKKIFYTQLLPELKTRGKMVIAVTHDEQYFHLCDRLIQLDYGKIICDAQSKTSAAHILY